MNSLADKKLAPDYRWVILIINFMICAFAYAGLTIWTRASAEISETFGISGTAASLGSSVFMVGYGVASVVENAIAARKGYRVGGLVGLIFMIIGSFGLPIAPDYGMVLVCRFLQGWGILWLIGVNSSVAWFPSAQRGLASSVIGAGLVVGVGSGSLLASVLIGLAGSWQGAFRYFAFILLVSTVIWAVLMKNPPENLYPEEKTVKLAQTSSSNINPFKTAAAWMCAICFFFSIFNTIGFNDLASSYLMDLGYTDVENGLVILFKGLIGIVSTPIGGIVSDRLAQKMSYVKARVLVQEFLGFTVAAVSCAIFPVMAEKSFVAAAVGGVLAGWGTSVINGTAGALPMDLLGDQKAANGMFALTCLLGLAGGGLLGPLLGNYFAELYGWDASMYLLSGSAVIGLILTPLLPRFQLNKDIAKNT